MFHYRRRIRQNCMCRRVIYYRRWVRNPIQSDWEWRTEIRSCSLLYSIVSIATRAWSQPVIKGTPPVPKDSHSCTTVVDNLFVFGGTDGMNPLKDLHILDTLSNT